MESKNKPKGNYQNKTNTLCKLTLEKSIRINKQRLDKSLVKQGIKCPNL